VFAIWIAVIAATRLSSLAALVASAAAPLVAYLLVTPWMAEICVLAVLIWLRHIGNIRRLLRGEESRIGSKS
jgi:glycerol-3-phosphate acyltransferase PlsY